MQLPDGNEIQIGPDRFKVPEILFQPVSCTAHSIALHCIALHCIVVCHLQTRFSCLHECATKVLYMPSAGVARRGLHTYSSVQAALDCSLNLCMLFNEIRSSHSMLKTQYLQGFLLITEWCNSQALVSKICQLLRHHDAHQWQTCVCV